MIEVPMYRRGEYWVAEAPYIHIVFVGRSQAQVGAAVRAALRRHLERPVEIEVKEGEAKRAPSTSLVDKAKGY
jgi:hypothetical protein